MNLFITGTDTDVGKTVVTAGIATVLEEAGFRTCVYKPVQSGVILDKDKILAPDLEFVSTINNKIKVKTSYKLVPPQAPSLAAILSNIEIDINKLKTDYNKLASENDHVIVEGAGGILCPVYQNFTMRDLIKLLDIPLIIVARPDLGTINHTLLTIEAAKNYGLNILGVIISNYPVNTQDVGILNAPKIIKEISGIDILGLLPQIENVQNNTKMLSKTIKENINLNKIFGNKL